MMPFTARDSKLYISHGHLEVEGGGRLKILFSSLSSLFWIVGVARGGVEMGEMGAAFWSVSNAL